MGGEIAGYRMHAALQRKARSEQSCLTSPGLKTEQATQACSPWAESTGVTSIPVYLLFASLVLELNPQVWPLDWTGLASSVPYKIPSH